MPTDFSEVAKAMALPFVADIHYNPRTNRYRVALSEPFGSELPPTRNFLELDKANFTVQELLTAFEQQVIQFYEQKYEQARQSLASARQAAASGTPDDSRAPWRSDQPIGQTNIQ